MKLWLSNFLHKLTHWEYWPYQVIYTPLWPVWLYYALRCRDLFFFCNTNPGIPFGGLTLESKYDIYRQMDPGSYPKTVLARDPLKTTELGDRLREHRLSFPLILKPDVGLKALGVYKIRDVEELHRTLPKFKGPVLVQEFISQPLEVGVFYVRMPWQYKGRITGIVSKDFLKVVGDGRRNLEQLIMAVPRARMQLRRLRKEWGDRLLEVPEQGVEVTLVPFGSHTRGALFQDRSVYITDELTAYVDHVAKGVYEFYFGRLDIKFDRWIDLARGRNLKVIEINGAGSEPTHIYDPGHSIFFAWREILRHWRYMYEISRYHRRHGYTPLSWKQGWQMLRDHDKLEKYLFSL